MNTSLKEETDVAEHLGIEDEDSTERESAIMSGAFGLKTVNDNAGFVSYRVVQFRSDDDIESVSPTNSVPSLLSTAQMNGSPGEGSDTKFALIAPSGSPPSEGTTVMTSGGQYFVIGEPVSFLQSSKSATPQTSDNRNSNTIYTRDEKRRVIHKEVERKRRDRINHWINRLGKVLPENNQAQGKGTQSKGGILAKACDYIVQLKSQVDESQIKIKRLLEKDWNVDILKQEVEILKAENLKLMNENAVLKAEIQKWVKSESTIITEILPQ